MSELKPCPFCGYEPETKEVHVYPNGEKSPAFIKCKRCNYHLFSYNEEGLFVHWNCRPTENALRAENERLRKALKVYADKKNWKNDDWGILSVFSRDDGGVGYGNPTAIAREALEVNG